MADCCKDCPYHYELTEEQLQGEYQGDCGCESLESTGQCWMADKGDEE